MWIWQPANHPMWKSVWVTNTLDGVDTLHPALEQALAVFPDGVARRAAAALRMMLHERMATGDARAWSSSKLTGDGFPVEFAFTTADDRLRYTVEPASWQDSPQRRLDMAIDLLSALASSTIDEEMISRWRRAQSQGRLHYGAWLAGRHGPVDGEYKIYVEAPDTDAGDSLPGVYPRPRLPDRAPKMRMVAYSPDAKQHEVYYRIQSLAPYHMPRVLAPCGLEARSQELLSYLTEAYGHALGERLPGASVGVSYALCSQAEPHSVTLFFFARVFWGADARIRQMFGRCSRAMNWDDSRYQQITAELVSHHTWMTQHGILGVTLARDGRLYLSIGVRPQG